MQGIAINFADFARTSWSAMDRTFWIDHFLDTSFVSVCTSVNHVSRVIKYPNTRM